MTKTITLILSKEIVNVGKAGDLVTVKAGYARNFLLPKKFGTFASASIIKNFKEQENFIRLRKKNVEQKSEALAHAINNINIIIPMKIDKTGKIFGSVTNKRIALELLKLGHFVNYKNINMKNTFKKIGKYEVIINLKSSIKTVININIINHINKKK